MLHWPSSWRPAKGRRMKSDLPKVLCEVCGRPLDRVRARRSWRRRESAASWWWSAIVRTRFGTARPVVTTWCSSSKRSSLARGTPSWSARLVARRRISGPVVDRYRRLAPDPGRLRYGNCWANSSGATARLHPGHAEQAAIPRAWAALCGTSQGHFGDCRGEGCDGRAAEDLGGEHEHVRARLPRAAPRPHASTTTTARGIVHHRLPGNLEARGQICPRLTLLRPCEALSVNTVEELESVEDEMRRMGYRISLHSSLICEQRPDGGSHRTRF